MFSVYISLMQHLIIGVTTLNEEKSLIHTAEYLEKLKEDFRYKIEISIILIGAPWGSVENLAILSKLLTTGDVEVFLQDLPKGPGSAIRQCLESIQSRQFDWFLLMASDSETPVHSVIDFVESILASNSSIGVIQGSRWVKNGGFVNYRNRKKFINLLSQTLCKVVYLRRIQDFTYGYRAVRKEFLPPKLLKENYQAFFLESLLLPIKLGAYVQEIPIIWEARSENESSLTKLKILGYAKPLIRLRVTKL